MIDSTPATWRPQSMDLTRRGEVENRHEWLVLDGEVLQKHPFSVWLQESATPPALVIGTTARRVALRVTRKNYSISINHGLQNWCANTLSKVYSVIWILLMKF